MKIRKAITLLFILLLVMFVLLFIIEPSYFYYPFINEKIDKIELPENKELLAHTENISASSEMISCHLSWLYKWHSWEWEILIPSSYYQFYSNRPRPKTSNYAVYVIHPFHAEAMKTLCGELEYICNKQQLNQRETIEFYANFIKGLNYIKDIDEGNEYEYPQYPMETLCKNGGDCEDKSIILASILSTLGYDVALIELKNSQHMLVGIVASDITGQYYVEDNGKRYYALEATNASLGIGDIPKKYAEDILRIRRVNNAPIIICDFVGSMVNFMIELTVEVENIGNAQAHGLKVFGGFDAGNNQVWNQEESSEFELMINERKEIMLSLMPPFGRNTRIIVDVVEDNHLVERLYSDWFDLK